MPLSLAEGATNFQGFKNVFRLRKIRKFVALGKVDFIEIGTLGDYIGKSGRIIVNEFDIEVKCDYLYVELIKSNGEKEDIRCSAKLTSLIQSNIDIVNYLPYFIVIETILKRKSISINRVSEERLELSDYIIEFHPVSEFAERLRQRGAELKKEKEEKQVREKLKAETVSREKVEVAVDVSDEERAWRREISKLRWRVSKGYITIDKYFQELEGFASQPEGSGFITENEWRELDERRSIETQRQKVKEDENAKRRKKSQEFKKDLKSFITLLVIIVIIILTIIKL